MASQTRVKVAKFDAPKMHGLDRDTLIRLDREMLGESARLGLREA